MIINCQENGRKTGSENGRKTGSENLKKWQDDHPEEQKENLKKWQKEHPKQVKENGRKLVEWNAKNHTFISRPEAFFYLTVLSKTFFLKDIIPQYYIKEIRHYADFAIPSQKLLFEVDGDYYHGHSGNLEMDKKAKLRDAQIDKWAKDNGWTIFRYNDKKMRKLGIL